MLWDGSGGVSTAYASYENDSFNTQDACLLNNIAVSRVIDSLSGSFARWSSKSGDCGDTAYLKKSDKLSEHKNESKVNLPCNSEQLTHPMHPPVLLLLQEVWINTLLHPFYAPKL